MAFSSHTILVCSYGSETLPDFDPCINLSVSTKETSPKNDALYVFLLYRKIHHNITQARSRTFRVLKMYYVARHYSPENAITLYTHLKLVKNITKKKHYRNMFYPRG